MRASWTIDRDAFSSSRIIARILGFVNSQLEKIEDVFKNSAEYGTSGRPLALANGVPSVGV